MPLDSIYFNISCFIDCLVSTIDQSWRQGKTPWIGNTFLSKSSKEKKGCLTAPRKFLSSRTLKIKSFDGSVGTINDSELPDIDLTSSILSTLQPSQHSSYSCSQNLNEEQNRKSRKKVVLLTDHSLKRMRETSNIYLEKNSAFHKQRMRNIESNIGNKHRTQLDRQMTEVEQIEHERHEKSIKNMKELANVRNRFLKEKQKRVRNTYVSVAALEMPEVDRYAYGLPADGKEYKFTKKKNVKNKASIEGRWQDSMQKARSIVKVLALREKVARTMTLPILKPLTSHKNRKKDVNRPDDTVLEDSVDTKLDIDQSIMDRASVKSDDFSREKSINAIKAFIDLTSESKFFIVAINKAFQRSREYACRLYSYCNACQKHLSGSFLLLIFFKSILLGIVAMPLLQGVD